MITDFNAIGRDLNWQTVNDTVMGGVSSSRIQNTVEGFVRFSGTLSLENNGGFTSMRSNGSLPDLSDCDSLVIRAKGDGRTYQLRVRTGSGWRTPNYSATFATTKGKWQEHRLPLDNFVPGWRGRTLRGIPPINPSKIQSLSIFLGDKKPGTFNLLVDWIKASAGRPARS